MRTRKLAVVIACGVIAGALGAGCGEDEETTTGDPAVAGEVTEPTGETTTEATTTEATTTTPTTTIEETTTTDDPGDDGASAEREVEEAVESFLKAIEDADANSVCEQLSSTAIKELGAVGSCTEVLGPAFESIESSDIEIPDFEITKVDVDGDEALVVVTSEGVEEEVPLVLEDGAWKIESASTLG